MCDNGYLERLDDDSMASRQTTKLSARKKKVHGKGWCVFFRVTSAPVTLPPFHVGLPVLLAFEILTDIWYLRTDTQPTQ